MTEIILKVHRRDEEPLGFTPPSGVIVHVQDKLTFVLVEGGMQSGEPSVMILGVNPQGHGVALETSLDKLLMAASGALSLAVHQLGWERQEGYASLIPGGPAFEGRFHQDDDDPDKLGSECTEKVCDRGHLHAIWTTDTRRTS